MEEIRLNENKDVVSESKFYMLRCLISIAHADGIFHEKEQEYIQNMMDRLPLSDKQSETLQNDMVEKHNVKELYPKISEPKYRGQVIHFMRLMAQKDGVYDLPEQYIVNRLGVESKKGLDIEAISEQAKKAAAADLQAHDIEIRSNRIFQGETAISFFDWLDNVLYSIGIDTNSD